jgi:hypothetical protein
LEALNRGTEKLECVLANQIKEQDMEESRAVNYTNDSCECRACLLKAFIHLEEQKKIHEEEKAEEVKEEELDDYDEVPCQGCGDSVPRGDVNQYRLGWWCTKSCAFYSIMY